MDITHLTVEVRDKNLNRIGQIPPSDLSLTIEDQFCNVGSWTLALPSESYLAGILRQPGSGIIVTLENGDVLMSGPTIKPEDSATSTDPNGTLTVNGLTDTVLLADRLCFPNPTSLDPANQPETHDVRTGACEDLMFAYVDANIGPSAPASEDPALGSRRDDRLQLGTNGHRGPTVTKRARFDVLGNLLNELAATAGIGFRIVQVGNKLEFQTFDVTDRSKSIRLDIRNNMLAGHKIATAPPSITRAIVAGQDVERDQGATDQEWAYERQFVAVSNADSRVGEEEWGRRVEVFIDRRQQDGNDELVQAGEEALQKGGYSQISVQVVPMEDFYSTFGVDWHLGDHITVVVQGEEMQADVTGYVLKYDGNGFRMGVTLGDPSTLDRSPARKVQTLDSRVSNLERTSVTPAALAAAGVKNLNPDAFTDSTPPANYPDGVSLLYLDPTHTTGSGWPAFSGKRVVVQTINLAAGDLVQTALRLNNNTLTMEQYMRSSRQGTWSAWQKVAIDADVAALDSRVDALEAYPPVRLLNQGDLGITESSSQSVYPQGTSILSVGSGSGWSLGGGLGTIVTQRHGANRCVQTFYDNNGLGAWSRTDHVDNPGWSPWRIVYGPKLPDPLVLRSNSVTNITATAWADHPTTGSGLSLSLPADAIVQIELTAWLSVNSDAAGSATVRLGVSHNGATPDASFDATWGNVLMESTQGGTTTGTSSGSGQHGMSVTTRLPAGTHTFKAQAYKTGTNSTSANYWVIRVVPLRWAE